MDYSYIIEGVALGLGLSILTGPLFFLLLEASIARGTRHGVVLATGVWFSDILISVVTLVFISQIQDMIESDSFKKFLGTIGGIVLVVMGIVMYGVQKKKKKAKPIGKVRGLSYVGYWMKGFVVNTANPFTFFFWATVVSSYVIGGKGSTVDIAAVIISIILTIVITDVLKILFADYISKYFTDARQAIMSKYVGAALCVFGVALLVRSFI